MAEKTKQPIIHIRVTQEVKDLLASLHTPVLKSDTAVLVNLIYEAAKTKAAALAKQKQ